MLRNVRRLTLGKFNGKDAKGPNVNLVCVLLTTLNQLWSHPAHSAYLTASGLSLLCKHHCVTEVSEFDLSIWLDQDVI